MILFTILAEHPVPVAVGLIGLAAYLWVRFVQVLDRDDTRLEQEIARQRAELRARGELLRQVGRNFHHDDQDAA